MNTGLAAPLLDKEISVDALTNEKDVRQIEKIIKALSKIKQKLVTSQNQTTSQDINGAILEASLRHHQATLVLTENLTDFAEQVISLLKQQHNVFQSHFKDIFDKIPVQFCCLHKLPENGGRLKPETVSISLGTQQQACIPEFTDSAQLQSSSIDPLDRTLTEEMSMDTFGNLEAVCLFQTDRVCFVEGANSQQVEYYFQKNVYKNINNPIFIAQFRKILTLKFERLIKDAELKYVLVQQLKVIQQLCSLDVNCKAFREWTLFLEFLCCKIESSDLTYLYGWFKYRAFYGNNCKKCGQLGHWKNECGFRFDDPYQNDVKLTTQTKAQNIKVKPTYLSSRNVYSR